MEVNKLPPNSSIAQGHAGPATAKAYAVPPATACKPEKLSEQEKQKRLQALQKAKEQAGKQ